MIPDLSSCSHWFESNSEYLIFEKPFDANSEYLCNLLIFITSGVGTEFGHPIKTNISCICGEEVVDLLHEFLNTKFNFVHLYNFIQIQISFTIAIPKLFEEYFQSIWPQVPVGCLLSRLLFIFHFRPLIRRNWVNAEGALELIYSLTIVFFERISPLQHPKILGLRVWEHASMAKLLFIRKS